MAAWHRQIPANQWHPNKILEFHCVPKLELRLLGLAISCLLTWESVGTDCCLWWTMFPWLNFVLLAVCHQPTLQFKKTAWLIFAGAYKLKAPFLFICTFYSDLCLRRREWWIVKEGEWKISFQAELSTWQGEKHYICEAWSPTKPEEISSYLYDARKNKQTSINRRR